MQLRGPLVALLSKAWPVRGRRVSDQTETGADAVKKRRRGGEATHHGWSASTLTLALIFKVRRGCIADLFPVGCANEGPLPVVLVETVRGILGN